MLWTGTEIHLWNPYFWHSWWGDSWISWGDFIFRVAPCSGVTSCQKRGAKGPALVQQTMGQSQAADGLVCLEAQRPKQPRKKRLARRRRLPKEGKQKRRRNQRRRLRLASELLFKQSLRKSESACWAAVDILEVPTGSEKVGESGEEEDSLSYAPTDPLDTGTKIKDKTRGKDSMLGPRQKDIGLSPLTP